MVALFLLSVAIGSGGGWLSGEARGCGYPPLPALTHSWVLSPCLPVASFFLLRWWVDKKMMGIHQRDARRPRYVCAYVSDSGSDSAPRALTPVVPHCVASSAQFNQVAAAQAVAPASRQ